MEFDTGEWKTKMQQKPMYKEQINIFHTKLYFHSILKSNNALCTEFCNNQCLFSSVLNDIMSSLHNTSVVLQATQILLSKF